MALFCQHQIYRQRSGRRWLSLCETDTEEEKTIYKPIKKIQQFDFVEQVNLKRDFFAIIVLSAQKYLYSLGNEPIESIVLHYLKIDRKTTTKNTVEIAPSHCYRWQTIRSFLLNFL